MSPIARTPLPFLVAVLFAALPGQARAQQQVQRCMAADGRTVYTDQRCDSLGAVDRIPPSGTAGASRLYRSGCPRVLSQLVGEIGAAVQSGDVNRLAGIYDWTGVSSAAAARLLDRLEQVVERPLVDIVPVYPEAPPATPPPVTAAEVASAPATAPVAADGAAAWMPSWTGARPTAPPPATTAGMAGSGKVEALPESPPPRPRPVALRVEQTLAGSATPARTVFGLRRSYGCFWITL